MSRTSKIPARHQSGSYIVSIWADRRVPAGVTTPEQADEHRASYHAKCDTRRVGERIETLDEEGQWKLVSTYKFVNQAKVATSNRRYAV